MIRFLAAAAIAAGALCVGSASAQTYNIVMTGTQQVPPIETSGRGTGYATLNSVTREFTLYVEFSGMIGPETLAHIHQSPVGTNGPIIFNFELGSPIESTRTLSNAELAQLNSGNWYVNLHSTVFPSGELRGQIIRGPFVGACCLPDNRCLEVTPTTCAAMSGVYEGDHARCLDSCGAPMLGACCIGESCMVTSPEACLKMSGAYQGNGAICTPGTCVGPPTCECDWNADRVLNSQDYFDFLSGFFVGMGDYNMDGITNSQDFFDFLTCFFNVPDGC